MVIEQPVDVVLAVVVNFLRFVLFQIGKAKTNKELADRRGGERAKLDELYPI